jgi:hypothetical protein
MEGPEGGGAVKLHRRCIGDKHKCSRHFCLLFLLQGSASVRSNWVLALRVVKGCCKTAGRYIQTGRSDGVSCVARKWSA